MSVFSGRVVCGVGVLVSGVLVAGLGASPAVAAPASSASDSSGVGSAVVGGFGVGDGVEALVDERSGGLSINVPVGAGGLAWSSASAGVDLLGLGPGWRIAGVGYVDVVGGVRVFPGSGGVFEADASVPSGLRNYVRDDLRFQVASGVLPARADGTVGERTYGFVLEELGGSTSYFGEDGNPIARLGVTGDRSDWEFDAANRLARTVDTDGIVTSWNWADPAGVRVITGAGTGAELVFVVDVSRGFVSQVVDPVGGVSRFTFDRGLLTQVSGVSGAVTEVSWQTLPDGAAAVDRLRVVDGATGAELSAREWDALSGTVSGYPAYRSEGELFQSGDPGYRYTTVVSDGHSRVVSEYNSLHLLIARHLEVDTPGGPRIVQEQALTYPETGDGGVPPQWDLPEQYALPTDTAVLFDADASTGGRAVAAGFVFDAFGRETSRTDPDGTITTTVYDDVVPDGKKLPVGLPIQVTMIAPDGLTSQARYELNSTRTTVVAEDTFTGTAGITDPDTGEVAWTRASRVERDVNAAGFVTAERTFPQGGDGTAVVTLFDEVVNAVAGTVTATQTVAAGTAAEVTASGISSLVTDQTLTRTDAVGNTTVVEYDQAGRKVSVTDAAGRTVTMRYRTMQADGANQTVTTTPDGVVVTETRDVLGRVLEVTDNIQNGKPVDGHVRVTETRTYPEPGITEITDAFGNSTRTRQDVLGREVETTAPNGLTKITQYDDIANTVTTGITPTGSLADAEVTSTQHRNERDQVVETTGSRKDQHPVLAQTAVFDGFGRATSSSDGSIDTTVAFDRYSNPEVTTLNPVPSPAEGMNAADLGAGVGIPITATRRFDEHGTSVEKTLSNGEQTRSGGSRVLDERGRTLAETAPDGTTTTTTYTPDDLIESTTTSYGQHAIYTYHPLTRRLLETVTTSPVGDSVTTGFEYDEITGDVAGVFDPADRTGTEIRYAYDAWGNTTSITYPDGKQVFHSYDPQGRLISTTDVAGKVTVLDYNKLGLPVNAAQSNPDEEALASVAYQYDDYGRVVTLTRDNGVTTEYTYTSTNLVDSETTTRAGEPQETRTYEYDPTGKLTTRTDTIHDEATGTPGSTHTVYGYDAHNRVVASTIHAGADSSAPITETRTYTVTVSGDIDTETVTTNPGTGEASTTRQFAYGPNGTITSITTTAPDGSITTAEQAYDVAGNVTHAIDGTMYTYNAANRQITETTPTGDTISTGYWANGYRAAVATVDGESERRTSFYWDGKTLINDTHSAGEETVTVSYLIGTGGNRHARATPGEVEHYTQDRHGNTVALTRPDGTPTARYTYTDYGTPTIHPNPATSPLETGTNDAGETATRMAMHVGDAAFQPFQYAGEYTNPTGTQHLAAREYDPTTLRFLTADTAPLHNAYAYGDLNPIMNVDPSGHTALPDWASWIIVGGALLLSIIGVAASALTFGAAHPLAVAGFITLAAEVGEITAMTLQKTTDLVIDPDALETAGLVIAAVGIVTAGVEIAASIAKSLTRVGTIDLERLNFPDASFATPRNFAEAKVKYASSPKSLAAWRMMYHKNGDQKTWYHGTNTSSALKIKDTGFDPRYGRRNVYGDGAYMTTNKETAEKFARQASGYNGGPSMLEIKPNIKEAHRVEWDAAHDDNNFTSLHRVRNPFWEKGMPESDKYLQQMLNNEDLYKGADSHYITVDHKNDPSEKLAYLVVHNQTPAEGALPTDAISIVKY